MSTPDEFERRLAARLEETGDTVAGDGVTLAGVEARHRERMRARRRRQGAGAAVAAGILAVLGVAVAAGNGGGGTTQVVADAGVDRDPGADLGPTTTVCSSAVPTTMPPETAMATTTMVWPPATIPPPTPTTATERGASTSFSTTTVIDSATGSTLPPAEAPAPLAGPGERIPPTTVPESTGPDPLLPEPIFPPDPCQAPDTSTTLPPLPPPPDGVGEPTTTTTEAPTTTEPAATVPADPVAVVPTHGASAWAVYLAVADEGAGPEAPALQQAADAAAAIGYDSTLVELACDEGGPWPSDPEAGAPADPSEPHWAQALYFTSELDALRFTDLFTPEVVLIDEVTTYCLD